MAELFKSRLKPLFRRSSTATTTPTTKSTQSSASSTNLPLPQQRPHSKASSLLSKRRRSAPGSIIHEEEPPLPELPDPNPGSRPQSGHDSPIETPTAELEPPKLPSLDKLNPTLTLEEPTPDLTPAPTTSDSIPDPLPVPDITPTSTYNSRSIPLSERRSLAASSPGRYLSTLPENEKAVPEAGSSDYFGASPLTSSAGMMHRKIWVKRPGQSATMVTINEEDLVDDARDMILKKYGNSLGRHFDAPDVTLRIMPRASDRRHAKGERTLGPEEQLAKTLDQYYPGGQSVDDALLINVPQRQTPRHSPRAPMQYYVNDDIRPSESGNDYFPTVPIQAQHSPRLQLPANNVHGSSHPALPHSMTMVTTGQPPAIPSPGGLSARHSSSSGSRSQRPRHLRQGTASPTVFGIAKSSIHDSLKSHPTNAPAPPPLPSPQIPPDGQPVVNPSTAPDRVASPRPGKGPKKTKKTVNGGSKLPASLIDGAVPPINVLIVEDNIINLKLLEAFMKRLKVRWHTAMNGRDAVTKWREGGFHLVLMDIQLPIMSGLEATKEIRRLERVNRIGVFSNSAASTPTFANYIEAQEEHPAAVRGEGENDEKPSGEDSLRGRELFKSPVIIVALTASSLQSDRHEALAAGCNDFLTKPVNFVWLERKVMEWGCMQALIDFDGWRKWKDFSQQGK
ncbi:MAG: hypothetical protein Q9174_002703, partial [Haloplaca sp. 1 TL-2023]